MGIVSRFSVAAVMVMATSGVMGAPSEYFGIRVVDGVTGRGVPLVELESTARVSYYTDSGGWVAFKEPGLEGKEVWFSLSSPGYVYEEEVFGYRGKLVKVEAGKEVVLKVKRENVAERLYRSTGQGIYRDSLLLGKNVPIAEPAMNRSVVGQDTAFAVPYKGELFWLWGDTSKLQFPLGNFQVTAARVKLPPPPPGSGGMDPDVGINFEYFKDEGVFTKEMARLSKESNPTWLDMLVVVKDEKGVDRLLARYARVDKAMHAVEQGLVVFNDEKEVFEKLVSVPVKDKRNGFNHQFRAVVAGKEYLYSTTPFPWMRVEATWEAVRDVERVECFTPVGADGKVEKDSARKAVWKWRKGVQPLDRHVLKELYSKGDLKVEESPFRLVDVDTGKGIALHNSSVCWNEYRKAFVMIGVSDGGDSNLGEIYFAEAKAPEGPWVSAKKVATHAKKNQNMDLYNPVQHPYFFKEGGRVIYFEGTYTHSFSGTVKPVPYYEYNQLMYKLDLGDSRLKLPPPPKGLSEAGASGIGAY